MSVLTPEVISDIDDATAHATVADIAGYLRGALGQRVVAYMVGAADPKQIADYAKGARVSPERERRLREGYKVVRMIDAAYSVETAKAWLFGTNLRLDDRAPVEVLAEATAGADFTAVRRAARQFASVEV